MGFFYRTIRMVEHGIKPAYVFDGKPPDLKSGVLSKRFEGRQKAKEDGEEAKEVGQSDLFESLQVYAAGSEDMDTLTFNAPVLYRHLTFSEAKKAPISEIVLEKALDGLGMNMEQFTELCILLGCDYLEPIRGVGPKNAFKLMQEHGSLKEVMKVLYAKMAEREEADLKKEKKAKAASAKKGGKSKSKKEDEDEDEAMESEEEEKPVLKKENKAKSKRRIESDEEEAEGEAGSDPWDDTVATSSPARTSSPMRASSPAASSDAGMKLDEDEEKKQDEEGEDDHKMEDRTEAEGEGAKEAKEEPKEEEPKGDGVAVKKEKTKKENDEAPKKPAPVRRGGIHVPEYYPWEDAKKLFLKPDVTPADQVELTWESPDIDGLVQFLVADKGFNEDRVRKGAEKLIKMLNTKQQGRLDGFFKVTESTSSKAKAPPGGKGGAGAKGAGAKRKADDKKDTGGKKAKTGGKK
ncbi:Elongation of fatty acids protein 2 [Ceratobasidium sp. 414]|nr:Elongation of fatty acids protein 2 [Ceratobasidium sp. 414]